MGIGLDPDTSITLVCAVAVALMFGLIAAALHGSAAGRHYQRRLNLVYDRARGNSSPETAAAVQSLSRERSATKLDRIARDWLPRREMLTARLTRTGRMISIGRYAMTMVGLAVLAASGLWIGTRLGILSCLSIGLLIGVLVPHLVIGRMGKRRVAAFVALFPDAIDLIVRALRSGLPVSEAIVGAGHEIADPVGTELRLVESGMRMGRDLETPAVGCRQAHRRAGIPLLRHCLERATRDRRQPRRNPRQSRRYPAASAADAGEGSGDGERDAERPR